MHLKRAGLLLAAPLLLAVAAAAAGRPAPQLAERLCSSMLRSHVKVNRTRASGAGRAHGPPPPPLPLLSTRCGRTHPLAGGGRSHGGGAAPARRSRTCSFVRACPRVRTRRCPPCRRRRLARSPPRPHQRHRHHRRVCRLWQRCAGGASQLNGRSGGACRGPHQQRRSSGGGVHASPGCGTSPQRLPRAAAPPGRCETRCIGTSTWVLPVGPHSGWHIHPGCSYNLSMQHPPPPLPPPSITHADARGQAAALDGAVDMGRFDALAADSAAACTAARAAWRRGGSGGEGERPGGGGAAQA